MGATDIETMGVGRPRRWPIRHVAQCAIKATAGTALEAVGRWTASYELKLGVERGTPRLIARAMSATLHDCAGR